MKRTVSVIVIMAMLLASVIAIIPVSAAATGTAINTAEDFLNMSASGEYYLAKDITIDEIYNGDFRGVLDGNGKTITLSGAEGVFTSLNGATVKNLKLAGSINKSDASVKYGALAKDAKNSTVSDVETSVKITVGAANTIASSHTGGLIGEVSESVTLKNCKNTGDISIKSTGLSAKPSEGSAAAGYTVGGLVGALASNAFLYADNCENAGAISALQTQADIGGIVGRVWESSVYLRGCTNSKPISLTHTYLIDIGYSGIGGMIGRARGGKANDAEKSAIVVYNCKNTSNAKISGSNCDTAFFGGIMGWSQIPRDITISGCTNDADIEAQYPTHSWGAASGMVGAYLTMGIDWGSGNIAGTSGVQRILNCTNNGNIKATNNEAAGMLARTIQMKLDTNKMIFEGCKNTGSITTVTSGVASGMVAYLGAGSMNDEGFSDVSIKNCKNEGNVTGAGDHAGGVLGYVGNRGYTYDFVVEGCTNKGAISSKHSPAGIVSKIANPTKFFVKNCANIGTISGGSAANDPIMSVVTAGSVSANITGCFSSTAASVSGATNNVGTATSMVNADITLALDKTDLNFQINLAKSLISENYTNATWNSVKTALTAAETAKNATSQTVVSNAANALYTAINALEAAQADTSALEALIAEAEEKKEEDYDIVSYGILSDALFDAKAALAAKIPSEVSAATAALQAALDGLVEAEYDDDDENNGDSNNGGDEDDDDDDGVTDGTTDGDATGGDDSGDSSDGKKKKKGCKSAITATAVVLSTVLALGAGVAFKKKED